MEAEAEVLILWPPEKKNWLIQKDLNDGKDWRQKKKGPAEDEMVNQHRWLNGQQLEQTPGDGGG